MLDYIIIIIVLIIALTAFILSIRCNNKVNTLLTRQVEINEGLISTLEDIVKIDSRIVKTMKEQANDKTKE